MGFCVLDVLLTVVLQGSFAAWAPRPARPTIGKTSQESGANQSSKISTLQDNKRQTKANRNNDFSHLSWSVLKKRHQQW